MAGIQLKSRSFYAQSRASCRSQTPGQVKCPAEAAKSLEHVGMKGEDVGIGNVPKLLYRRSIYWDEKHSVPSTPPALLCWQRRVSASWKCRVLDRSSPNVVWPATLYQFVDSLPRLFLFRWHKVIIIAFSTWDGILFKSKREPTDPELYSDCRWNIHDREKFSDYTNCYVWEFRRWRRDCWLMF